MNIGTFFLIFVFFVAGVGLYVGLRSKWNWPTRNNPLFFAAIFAPALLIVITPLSAHPASYVVYSLSGGLFLADSWYYWNQDRKHAKAERLKAKEARLRAKNKSSSNKKRP